MADRKQPFISHIYGIKDGTVCHLYLDERRMRKKLVNLRSDGSQVVHEIPFARDAALEAADIFGFSNAIEIRNRESDIGEQLLAQLEAEACRG